jgi:hypothetical protein
MRIRMRMPEIERFEGIGRGAMGFLRLWKCVEKSKVTDVRPTSATPAPALPSKLGVRGSQFSKSRFVGPSDGVKAAACRGDIRADHFKLRAAEPDGPGTLQQNAKSYARSILGHVQHNFVVLPSVCFRDRPIVHVVKENCDTLPIISTSLTKSRLSVLAIRLTADRSTLSQRRIAKVDCIWF